MKVKEISISRYIKVGLPNYSSDQVGVSLTVEGDDFDEAWEMADKQLKDKLDELGYTGLWELVTDKASDPDPEWLRKGGLA